MESRIHLKNNEILSVDINTTRSYMNRNMRLLEIKTPPDETGKEYLKYAIPIENIWYIESPKTNEDNSGVDISDPVKDYYYQGR